MHQHSLSMTASEYIRTPLCQQALGDTLKQTGTFVAVCGYSVGRVRMLLLGKEPITT